MLMTYVLLAMLAGSVLYGAATGSIGAISAAVTQGAGAAVSLAISITGTICLWSAVMEAMSQCGLLSALMRLLRPLLRRIFPRSFEDTECGNAIALNFTANLLGLGNAATPAGLKATERMALQSGGSAGNELCRLVVMNTASLQLIPTTVAAVRAGLGAGAPFDILPCVWLTSLCSVSAGLLTAKVLERLFP